MMTLINSINTLIISFLLGISMDTDLVSPKDQNPHHSTLIDFETINGQVQISSSVDFGVIAVGSRSVKHLDINNTSDSVLIITEVSFENNHFKVGPGLNLPVSIDVEGFFTLPIVASPGIEGLFSDHLILKSDDSTLGETTVTMDSRPYSVGPQQQFAIDFDPSPILADFNQNPISIYQKVDNNFELQKRIYQSPDSPLISTYGLVIDADGNVLTYNFKDQRLYQVSKNGIRPISQKKQLLAIAYDHQDRLWALRQSNDSLLLGPVNTQTLQFTSSPLSLAISRDCFQGPISATEDYINCNLPTNGLTFDPISYDPWISSTSGDIYHISLTDSSVESQIKVTSVLRDINFDLNGNLYGVLSGLKPNSNFYSTDYISIDKSTGQIEFINNTNGNLWSIETSPTKNSEIRFSKTIDASKIYQRDTSSIESFVWVTNESPNDLIIESSTVDSIVSIDPSLFPVSIAPNTTHQFPLSINPNVAHQGFFLSPLSFQSNDSLFSAKTIAVYGEVLPPLSLPDSLDMGVVPTIESGTYEILVQNHGDQAITIESIESDIAETDPIEVIAELPRTLNPGENYTITLNFSPNSTASYAKTIQLITSDQINPEIKINGESIIPIDSWTTCYESWLCDLGIVGESFPFSLSISNVLDQLVTIDSITSTGPFSVKEHGIINIHPYKFLNLDLFFWEPVESGQNSGSIILHFGNHQIHIPIWANAVDAFTVERNKVFGLSYSVDTTNSVVAYNLMSIDDGFNIQLNQESFNHYSFKSSCIDEKGRIYGIGDKRLYRTNGNSVYRNIPLNGISSPRISAAAFNHSDNKFYVYSESGGLYVENREDRTFEYLGKATESSIELNGGKVVSMVVNPSNEHLVLFYMDGQDEKYHILEFNPNNLSDRTNRMLEYIYPELTDIFYNKHNTLFGLSGQIVVNLDAECPTSLKHLSEPLYRIICSSNSVNIDFEVSQSDDFIFTLDEKDLASDEYIYFLNGNGLAVESDWDGYNKRTLNTMLPNATLITIDPQGNTFVFSQESRNVGKFHVKGWSDQYSLEVDFTGISPVSIRSISSDKYGNLYCLTLGGGILKATKPCSIEDDYHFELIGRVDIPISAPYVPMAVDPVGDYAIVARYGELIKVDLINSPEGHNNSAYNVLKGIPDKHTIKDLTYSKQGLVGLTESTLLLINESDGTIIKDFDFNLEGTIALGAFTENPHLGTLLKSPIANENIEIFPNPTSNDLHVKLSGTFKDQEIEISLMDIAGRKVIDLYENFYEGGDNENVLTFSLDELKITPGLYFLRVVQSKQKPSIQKLVIE